MRSNLIAIITILASTLCMADQPTKEIQHNQERKLSEWLSHPSEFDVLPKSATYRSTIPTKFTWSDGPEDVHLIDYVMPDGTIGVGFTGPTTWSFLGDLPYEDFSDLELVQAYTGWFWLFHSTRQGAVSDTFEPTNWDMFTVSLAEENIDNISRKAQYRIGTSEIFEFKGTRNGNKIVGAGTDDLIHIFNTDSRFASLPVVYTLLGRFLRDEN